MSVAAVVTLACCSCLQHVAGVLIARFMCIVMATLTAIHTSNMLLLLVELLSATDNDKFESCHKPVAATFYQRHIFGDNNIEHRQQ